MTAERMAEAPALITTYTVDRLAYSLSPAVVATVVDLEGGGRFQVRADRRGSGRGEGPRSRRDDLPPVFTASGVHNYFWKARLIR